MSRFDEIYKNTLSRIMTEGIPELNTRTNHETRALPGISFELDVEKEGFPLLTLRKIPIKLFIAEQIWFIAGSRKPEDFLGTFTHIWDDFTNPGNVVTVAYGYRWRKHFGRDQLNLLIELLKKDPSSRHGVVVTWDPAQDGLGGAQKANLPCPYTFTVNIIGGRLNLHNMVRSNDMLIGFPHDVAGFALLQHILAQQLNLHVGVYSHSISNAHVYDTHYDGAHEIIRRATDHPAISCTLPANTFERAEKKDVALVEEIANMFSKQYTPQAPISGLNIVL